MELIDTDPLMRSWAYAITALIVVAVTIPVLRLTAALLLHAWAAVTGRHHLHTLAHRVMPRIAHVLGSLVIGVTSMAAPAFAQDRDAVPPGVSIDLDRDAGASHAQDATPAVTPEAAPKTQTKGSLVYVVRAGDTLWDIAQEQLDTHTDAETTDAWKAIWRANRTVIGDHPEEIVPGQALTLGGIA